MLYLSNEEGRLNALPGIRGFQLPGVLLADVTLCGVVLMPFRAFGDSNFLPAPSRTTKFARSVLMPFRAFGDSNRSCQEAGWPIQSS